MLKQGRNRKRHRPLPSPFPHRFLFRPRFCFRAVVSLTLRNAKHKGKYTTKKTPVSFASYAYVWACPMKVSGFSISKARKMLRPCWNKVYRKSNRLTYLWGGVKWFQHRLSTTLLKRICLNNLESVWPRLFLNSTIIPDPVIHIHKS